jgi:hypothetical protein
LLKHLSGDHGSTGLISEIEFSEGADAESLTQADSMFASKTLAHNPNYRHERVNLDGWETWSQQYQT